MQTKATLIPPCQITPVSDSFKCWHQLIAFSHSSYDFPVFLCKELFSHIWILLSIVKEFWVLLKSLTVSLTHRFWPTFVGYGSNSNLIFRVIEVLCFCA